MPEAANDRALVGFIGLGLMGQGFVERLITMGHKVIALDVVPEKVDQAVKVGAKAAFSVRGRRIGKSRQGMQGRTFCRCYSNA